MLLPLSACSAQISMSSQQTLAARASNPGSSEDEDENNSSSSDSDHGASDEDEDESGSNGEEHRAAETLIGVAGEDAADEQANPRRSSRMGSKSTRRDMEGSSAGGAARQIKRTQNRPAEAAPCKRAAPPGATLDGAVMFTDLLYTTQRVSDDDDGDCDDDDDII